MSSGRLLLAIAYVIAVVRCCIVSSVELVGATSSWSINSSTSSLRRLFWLLTVVTCCVVVSPPFETGEAFPGDLGNGVPETERKGLVTLHQ